MDTFVLIVVGAAAIILLIGMLVLANSMSNIGTRALENQKPETLLEEKKSTR